jgi:class I fructose-bisphosphate aldolase
MPTDIEALLGHDAQDLLTYQCKGITADELTLPGPDYTDRVLLASDRPIPVVRNLASVYAHGRLGGTGYLSILPVDQGVEHSAAASFAKNPAYFDPANLVELALAGSK